MKSTGNARKNRARKSHGKKIGRLIGRYGAVALAGARLVYDVLIRTDVLR
jgi:hypothetical protein